jgi:hypothetical protein
MVFVDEHLELFLYLFVILVDVIVIGELLDRFSKLRIDLDKFFQRLLQHGIFLLELVNFLSELLVFALTSEVVLETVRHCCIYKYK